jgi:hypothetical protein
MNSKQIKWLLWLVILLDAGSNVRAQGRWSVQRAQYWYARQGWLCGVNFIPSTAVNQLEMWQLPTFDTLSIDRELFYAQDIGMNLVRVFLHHAAWQADPAGFKGRLNTYLGIAAYHDIKTIVVFFDDCWNDNYQTGPQPKPVPGKHNSRWLKDPGSRVDKEPKLADTLETYVKDIVGTFRQDKRILCWDLYNEPGQFDRCGKSLPLLKMVFQWVRSVKPTQPLTVGFYDQDKRLKPINDFILANSDIITYHCYEKAPAHQPMIDSLRIFGRPLICTEYMARKRGSTFAAILPILKKEHIGAISWGLVSGKTNTIFAWDDPQHAGKEPALWFHDIYRGNGTPYNKTETDLIRSLTKLLIK